MSTPPIHFLWSGREPLDELSRLDPDRQWREFNYTQRIWILQTYLRLRDAGAPVTLTKSLPRSGIVIHSAGNPILRRHWRELSDLILVAVRADRKKPLLADLFLYQNRRFTDGVWRLYVPHWPQPGLVPRDPDRGTTIRRVAFKGYLQSLHPELRSRRWREFLAQRGIEWVADSPSYDPGESTRSSLDWASYTDVDLIVAVRPDTERWLHKPASKLFNAWLAGVPALLGPEQGYRELRRSELDYLEVRSVAEAEAAVSRLLEDPGLYQRMVDNGLERGHEFTVERVLDRWLDLVERILPAAGAELPGGVRLSLLRALRLFTSRPYPALASLARRPFAGGSSPGSATGPRS